MASESADYSVPREALAQEKMQVKAAKGIEPAMTAEDCQILAMHPAPRRVRGWLVPQGS